jgi:hypothetical protein
MKKLKRYSVLKINLVDALNSIVKNVTVFGKISIKINGLAQMIFSQKEEYHPTVMMKIQL